MAQGTDVLERKVIHAGKIFIKAGEENSRAYVIQQGSVRAFIEKDGEKVQVARHGPGTIIGETCLALDEPIQMSYEALVDTTVVTVTRQDFQKKLTRVDQMVKRVFNQVLNKLYEQDTTAIEEAGEKAEIDDDAIKIVQGLLATLPPDKQHQYEKAILPHLNALIKEIKGLKTAQRHEAQQDAVDEKIAQLKQK
ncbi:MAG: cyclic nucleotide-binding domain-containing protein [Rhodospirillales bacterium]|nr:cyclic nucleotide-binding domain-containing protein [Rhodospirillales bacterium]